MQYFDLTRFQEYKTMVRGRYSASSPSAQWLKETRDKLGHLVTLLSQTHGIPYQIVYKERPNGQGGQGRIIFKEYVLTGFAPIDNSIEDDLFIKLEFGKLDSDSPVFNINLDLNFRKATSPFIHDRDKIYNRTYKEYLIDNNFPQNWEDLIAMINSDVLNLKRQYDQIVRSLDFNMGQEKLITLLEYKKQIILQGPPGTGKTKLAKELAQKLIGITNEELITSGQFDIIQFHPSYSYEDFVRGIVAQSEGDKIVYKNINKTLGTFAKEALNNFVNSQKDEETLSYEKWVESNFENFIDDLDGKLILTPIDLTDKVNIISIDDDAFRYKGKKGWSKLGNRMLFEDIIQAIVDENKTRKDLKNNDNLSGLAKWHASYYIRVIELFHSFIKERKLTYQKTDESKIPLKKYVLIIDEINRANLSSVLGELIYALEYRGESVNSMYEIDDKKELIIPPNLFIIGTMNTADRSVGTIDYAIRRRFAFVDILPKDLTADLGEDYKSELFTEVSKLFIENYNPAIDYTDKNIKHLRSQHLSEEFNPQDVWLGHSYFIQHYEKDSNGENKPVDFKFRLDYEIKPILHEYIKDGILKESAFEEIEKLTC